MTTCLGKSCSLDFTVRVFRERSSIYVCSFPFGFWAEMWGLILLIPDRCLSTSLQHLFITCQSNTIVKRFSYHRLIAKRTALNQPYLDRTPYCWTEQNRSECQQSQILTKIVNHTCMPF